MTCTILRPDAPSKKALRETLKAAPHIREEWRFRDPAIIGALFNGAPFSLSSLAIGQNFLVTNHPKRSWFAKITRTSETTWRIE